MCYNTHIVHPPSTGDASKPTRNGLSFILMELLIATAFTCSDAYAVIEAMKEYDIREETRIEMIQVVKEEMSICPWDAKAD